MTGRQDRVLLAVFAHPDDETFLAGPILARYAHEGARVELLVATADTADLTCAAERLGISRVRSLGYRSSPMFEAGPSSNQTPPATCSHPGRSDAKPPVRPRLADVPLPDLAGAIGDAIADVKPQVVLVDAPYGSYGHPDHVIVHRATVQAVEAVRMAGVSGTLPGDCRLYALAFPMPLVRLNLRLMRLRGAPVSGMGPDGSIDLQEIVSESKGKTGLVSVGRYVRFRRAASACYEKEIEAAPLPLKALERSPLWVQRLVFSRQAITRLSPPADRFERDLFARVGLQASTKRPPSPGLRI